MINKSIYIVTASLFAGGFSASAAPACCPVDSNTEISKASIVEGASFTEAELFSFLGQYMALTGGVHDLKFTDEELAVFAEGMALPLVNENAFDNVEDALIEAAIEQAMARLEPAEGNQELTPFSADAPRYLGFVVALQAGIVGLGLSPEEGEQVRKGAIIGARLEEPTEAMQAAMQPLSELMNARIEKIIAAQGGGGVDARSPQEHKAEAEVFLSQLGEEEANLKVTESGLRYLVLEEGNGKKPNAKDSVRVHYHGTLIDGSVFDSSVLRGEPADFPLQGVVPGFAEGLQKVGVGGKVRLFIPSHLAYGDQARPGSPIPGGALIIFDCELIAVNP
jgi:FKBP-type peptidyl-prolyl cis-trans isomerase